MSIFSYDAASLDALEISISCDRLSSYINDCDDDRAHALRLYLWNGKVSSAFYVPLQGLEICFRNALHRALCHYADSDDWYDKVFLDTVSLKAIADAKHKVERSKHPVDPSHVVAELSFGFWVALLNKSYHQKLWIPALGKAFQNARKPRSEIHDALNHIRVLRNRIAHHEPIFKRHLSQDYESIIKITSWINPVKADWVDRHSTVTEILNQRP